MRELALDLVPPATVRMYDGPDDLAALDAFLARPRPYTALDVETTGAEWGDTVRTVQLGDDREAWVIRAEHAEAVRHALAAASCRWLLAWNSAFDAEHVARLLGLEFGPFIERFLDTAVLAGVLDPRAAYQGGVGRGLKQWAEHVCGKPAGDFDRARAELFRRERVAWATVDPTDPVMLAYAGSDPVLTYRAHRHLAGLVSERSEVVRREQRLARLVAGMRHRGFAIDPDAAESAFTHYRTEYAEHMTDLLSVGVSSVHKPREVARALADEGHDGLLTTHTRKGAVSVARPVLVRCEAAGSQVAHAVIAAKAARRLADFVDTYRQAARFDGRVHAGIKSIGTRTRRMTSSGPNLQQTPKGDARVRGVFRPGDGLVVVRADYSSMELRFMAMLSRDHRLRGDLAADVPIFEQIAESVWGAGSGSGRRDTAKVVAYATCYGAGADRLAEITGLPRDEAEALRRAWWDRYPTLFRTFFDLRDEVRARGALTLPRSGELPVSEDRAFCGLNVRVQAGCRDAFADRLLALDDAGLGEALVLPVHDEVVLVVPEGDAGEVERTLQAVLPVATSRLAIPVEVSTGPSWGAAYAEHGLTDDDRDLADESDDDDRDLADEESDE